MALATSPTALSFDCAAPEEQTVTVSFATDLHPHRGRSRTPESAPRLLHGPPGAAREEIHHVLREQLRKGGCGAYTIDPDAVPHLDPQPPRGSAAVAASPTPRARPRPALGGSSPRACSTAAAPPAGDFRASLTTATAAALLARLPAPRPHIAAPAPQSTISVLLGPSDAATSMPQHTAVSLAECGALAFVAKRRRAGDRSSPPPSGAAGQSSVEVASLFGFHPCVARINVGRSAPPGTRIAASAVLVADHAVMRAVIEVLDVERRVALDLALEVRLNEAARRQRVEQHGELRAAAESAHAELARARADADAALARATDAESRAARLAADLHTLQHERRELQDRCNSLERDVARHKEFEARRLEERQRELAKETEMERLRQREREAIRQREQERDAERALARQRHVEREAERRHFAAELDAFERERREFEARESRLHATVAELQRAREVAKERERGWRTEMRRVLTENMVCQVCAQRRALEVSLAAAQGRNDVLGREVAALTECVVAHRAALFPLQINPPPPSAPIHSIYDRSARVSQGSDDEEEKDSDSDGGRQRGGTEPHQWAEAAEALSATARADSAFLRAHNLWSAEEEAADLEAAEDADFGSPVARRRSPQTAAAHVSLAQVLLKVAPDHARHGRGDTNGKHYRLSSGGGGGACGGIEALLASVKDDDDDEVECDASVAVFHLANGAARAALQHSIDVARQQQRVPPSFMSRPPRAGDGGGGGAGAGGRVSATAPADSVEATPSPVIVGPRISNCNTPRWPRDTSTVVTQLELPFSPAKDDVGSGDSDGDSKGEDADPTTTCDTSMLLSTPLDTTLDALEAPLLSFTTNTNGDEAPTDTFSSNDCQFLFFLEVYNTRVAGRRLLLAAGIVDVRDLLPGTLPSPGSDAHHKREAARRLVLFAHHHYAAAAAAAAGGGGGRPAADSRPDAEMSWRRIYEENAWLPPLLASARAVLHVTVHAPPALAPTPVQVPLRAALSPFSPRVLHALRAQRPVAAGVARVLVVEASGAGAASQQQGGVFAWRLELQATADAAGTAEAGTPRAHLLWRDGATVAKDAQDGDGDAALRWVDDPWSALQQDAADQRQHRRESSSGRADSPDSGDGDGDGKRKLSGGAQRIALWRVRGCPGLDVLVDELTSSSAGDVTAALKTPRRQELRIHFAVRESSSTPPPVSLPSCGSCGKVGGTTEVMDALLRVIRCVAIVVEGDAVAFRGSAPERAHPRAQLPRGQAVAQLDVRVWFASARRGHPNAAAASLRVPLHVSSLL